MIADAFQFGALKEQLGTVFFFAERGYKIAFVIRQNKQFRQPGLYALLGDFKAEFIVFAYDGQ